MFYRAVVQYMKDWESFRNLTIEFQVEGGFNLDNIRKKANSVCLDKTGEHMVHMFDLEDENGDQYRSNRKPSECPQCWNPIVSRVLKKVAAKSNPADHNLHDVTYKENCPHCGWEKEYTTEVIDL